MKRGFALTKMRSRTESASRLAIKLKTKHNKKGQFFLIIAVIVILILYTLTINYNWVRESVQLDDYNELRDNYNIESPKVLNNAIYITTDPSKCKGLNADPKCPLVASQNFAKDYQKFANQKDPNFGLVSIIKDPVTGNIIVQNLLSPDKYIQIKPNNNAKEIILLSDNSRSTGTITLNGIGQVSTSTPVSSFSSNFTNADIGNTKIFKICIKEVCQEVNTADWTTSQQQTITNSEQGATIDYDICPPVDKNRANRC